MTLTVFFRRVRRAGAVVCVVLFWHGYAYADPFLWKAKNEQTEFYLFGTIHLPDPRITTLSNQVIQALNDASVFYAELDLDESSIMHMQESMWLPENLDLHELLPDSLEQQVDDYLQQTNPDLNLEFFSNQKIWVFAITLTLLETQLNNSGRMALDTILFQKAVNLGLKTGGLETVNEQLRVFDALSLQQQLIFLEDTLEFLQAAKQRNFDFIEDSINAYLDGDLEHLMTSLTAYMHGKEFYSQLLDRLIDQRNKRMTERILHLVNDDQNTYFFALGAGHFWGQQGIIARLKKAGYQIHTVQADSETNS